MAHPQNGISSDEIAEGLTGICNCREIVKYQIKRCSTNEDTQNTRYKRENKLTVIKIYKIFNIILMKYNKI